MTRSTHSTSHQALALTRTLGAAILTLAVLLGVGGALKPAAAAAPAPTKTVFLLDQAAQPLALHAGFQFKKAFGFKRKHGFRAGGFKHGGFKRKHGFRYGGFKHGGFVKKDFGGHKPFLLKGGKFYKPGFGRGIVVKKGFAGRG